MLLRRTDRVPRILAVDDNKENLDLIRGILGFSGYDSIRTLSSSKEAVQTIIEWNPDLVLLDLHMPPPSGYDILTEMSERLPRDSFVPVLVFTADWTREAKTKAFELGAHDFLTKPFEATELLARVRNFLNMRELHLELQERNAKLVETNEALQESEESSKRLSVDLQVANRELEGFTHSVSHDLRGPLRAIQSTSHMLLEDCRELLPPESLAMLERQAFNAKKITTIIDELLRLSRVSKTEMNVREVNLSELARDVAGEISGEIANPQVRFDIAEDLIARGDPLLLRLVLVNLLGNAAKFSPKGGTVEVQKVAADAETQFVVRDQGIGFDMNHLDRLFKPFERLVRDDEFPGTGIGLANVRRIIERHAGKVWAESEPSKGSSFYFTLNTPSLASRIEEPLNRRKELH